MTAPAYADEPRRTGRTTRTRHAMLGWLAESTEHRAIYACRTCRFATWSLRYVPPEITARITIVTPDGTNRARGLDAASCRLFVEHDCPMSSDMYALRARYSTTPWYDRA